MIDVKINHAYPHCCAASRARQRRRERGHALTLNRADATLKPTQALEFVARATTTRASPTSAARSTRTCGRSNRRSTSRCRDAATGSRSAGAGARAHRARELYNRARDALSVDDIQLALVEVRHTSGNGRATRSTCAFAATPTIRSTAVVQIDASEPDEGFAPKLYTRRADLRGRTPAQREYLKQILSHDVTFGIGPAGTGKTYLACAVDALERDH